MSITTLADLRRFTVVRNFPRPTSLRLALNQMGFVQADPIRAPARAQDLILRHRVRNYRAGDLERRYQALDIEEDFFVTYGFVTRSLHALMHPRSDSCGAGKHALNFWPAEKRRRAQLLLDFVREHGPVHPRTVDEHFSHGRVTNYWGGSSNATTHLLDEMHYRGMLRIARRDKGVRVYFASEFWNTHNTLNPDERQRRIDALVDVVVRIYAPLPAGSLALLVRQLRYAAPQWQAQLTSALQRARERLAHAQVDGREWYWPQNEDVQVRDEPDAVRLLAPFDPVVRDRDRFALLWGWNYRFEAYTPEAKRKLGYYAMPLLWRDRVIGWANLSVRKGRLLSDFGYCDGRAPRDPSFKRELEAELARMRTFLDIKAQSHLPTSASSSKGTT